MPYRPNAVRGSAIAYCRKCLRLDGCVCDIPKEHTADCPYRRAIMCPVDVECEHGHTLCPKRDRCNCPIPAPGEAD